jgi:ubiquinone/menaquinone biosynthesis C-methylase UbiE
LAQNIYDNEEFFISYGKLPRSTGGLAGAPEWPALRAMLPPLTGRKIVDLGCGYGWFARFARKQGATEVLALDISENMLTRARAMTNDDGIVYLRADLENLDLPQAAFDLAFSSLAFHYVVDLAKLFRTVHRSLVPEARFVFSMEHPIYMAPSAPEWLTTSSGRRVWPVDGYACEGARCTDWLAKGVVKQHRRLSTTLNLLTETGFRLRHIDEWAPADAEIAAHPDWAAERDRPMFLLIAAER